MNTPLLQTKKRHLVIEAKDEDMWTILPTPGFVVKFRDAKLVQSSQRLVNYGGSESKFFVNIAHCMELPGPTRDLDEVCFLEIYFKIIKNFLMLN